MKSIALERKRMHRCVRCYDRTVALGQVAIYHLHIPEPVTIAIHLKVSSGAQLGAQRPKYDTVFGSAAVDIPAAGIARQH